jgi:hypothetical protein
VKRSTASYLRLVADWQASRPRGRDIGARVFEAVYAASSAADLQAQRPAL